MAKDAILQVRIDAELKKNAEDLFRDMGISLSEAVRMFVAQSVQENQLPFRPHSTTRRTPCKAFGVLSLYRNPSARAREHGRRAQLPAKEPATTASSGDRR